MRCKLLPTYLTIIKSFPYKLAIVELNTRQENTVKTPRIPERKQIYDTLNYYIMYVEHINFWAQSFKA